MAGEDASLTQGDSGDRSTQSLDFVEILSALFGSCVIGLCVALAIFGIGFLGYFYIKGPAGAWTYQLFGMDREVYLTMAAASLGLMKLGIRWLIVICIIIGVWQAKLARLTAR